MKYTLLFILISLFSCQSRDEIIFKKIIGNWIIYEFKFNGKDCKEDLLINAMSFHSDSKFLIPEIYEYPAEDEEDNTHWNVMTDSLKNSFLTLNCKNPVFKNNYKIKFIKNNEKRALGVELISDSTYILAYKTLQDFDVDGIDW